jgi:hypothetical protein
MSPQALLALLALIWVAAVVSWWRTAVRLENIERRFGGVNGAEGDGRRG